MAVTLEKFIEKLTDSGLMSAAVVRTFIDTLPEDQKPADGEALAKKLVAEKKLTSFQAQQIWKGRGKNLVLGTYVISEKLGQGGMGMVFKASHKLMKRDVALKVLPPAVTKDKNAVKRFLREVEAVAKPTHPNIVAAHDADQAGDTLYLIMEYVEGRDLSAIVKKQGPATVEQAADFILQAARGLAYAHQNGVIHRDIKPANLLLDQSGTVKILDMGLARIEVDNVDAATQAGLTGTGMIMGTVDYMSPEQAVDTKTADARADIYSLGMSLYFLLSGKPAYEGDSLTARLLAHQTQPIPSLRSTRNEVPEPLDALFQKMVAKKPEDRYQTMSEVVGDLEAVLAGGNVAAAESSRKLVATSPQAGAMNAFLAGPDQSQTAVHTGAAAVGGSTPAGSDTDAGSVQMATRASVPVTQRLTRAVAKVPPDKRKLVFGGGGVAAVLLLGALIWGGGGDRDAKSLGNATAMRSGENGRPLSGDDSGRDEKLHARP